MRRTALGLATLMLLSLPAGAQAEKLPIDEGLQVTLAPDLSKMKVGQVVDFSLEYTDDDAVSAEVNLFVEANGGTGMFGDGACATPLERQPSSGGALARATFNKPGKYVVRGVVKTSACHGQITGMGHEEVVVTRTITVTR